MATMRLEKVRFIAITRHTMFLIFSSLLFIHMYTVSVPRRHYFLLIQVVMVRIYVKLYLRFFSIAGTSFMNSYSLWNSRCGDCIVPGVRSQDKRSPYPTSAAGARMACLNCIVTKNTLEEAK